jgi:AcrR family transcriptional regulator
MPRRSEHGREELAANVVAAATELAEAGGLRGVTMRRIAQRVGCSPGSIYNAVGDLDAVLQRMNAGVLDALSAHLHAVRRKAPADDPMATLLALVDTYMDEVAARPRLWSALFDYAPPPGRERSAAYLTALRRPFALAAEVLAPVLPDTEEQRRAALALWGSLQGIIEYSAADKLAAVAGTEVDARALVHVLFRRLFGLGPP